MVGSKKNVKKSFEGVELTEAEWAIIRTIWKLEPCTAPDVTESLAADRKWSYSTVKTMMDRMVDKGLLTTEKLRNLILHRSAITVNEAQKGEVLRTLKRAFDGAMTPMMQFLIRNESLSKEEIRQLETLLKEKKK
ncbi:MAG: BlaI/MecI/CopY family transcriptional regulator [Phycisphaerae bacterium]|nr:BlaI/MecI/CopY family transcriptional regulator [Phycisphaerae bacterium]